MVTVNVNMQQVLKRLPQAAVRQSHLDGADLARSLEEARLSRSAVDDMRRSNADIISRVRQFK